MSFSREFFKTLDVSKPKHRGGGGGGGGGGEVLTILSKLVGYCVVALVMHSNHGFARWDWKAFDRNFSQ